MSKHKPLGELDEQGRLVYTVTSENRYNALTGHQFDRIVIQCEVTDDELDHFRTRLAPGGELVQPTLDGAQSPGACGVAPGVA
jgi:protein-L-isoaspartate O-methyltransferase